jgi:hypothetical protein
MNNAMMVPVYTGNYKQKEKAANDNTNKTKKPNYLGRRSWLDEEDPFWWQHMTAPTTYRTGLEGMLPKNNYGGLQAPRARPAGMGQMGNPYSAMPAQMGGNSMINIQYTSPDGTMYQMGVTSSPENTGYALANVLNGLYGLMMSEENGYGDGGKGGGYAGGGGGHASNSAASNRGSSYGGGKGK